MKFINLLLLIILLGSCESSDKVKNLTDERNALQLKVNSLEAEIAELTKTPDDLVNDVKANVRNGELATAKQSLVKITSRQLSSRLLSDVNKLLAVVNTKLEEKDYQSLLESDTTLYSDFIHNYPKSKYSGIVRKKLKKFRQVQQAASDYTDNTSTNNTKAYRQKRYSKSYGTTRIGAMCCDGTRSYATGRGACSHHGGVCQWLYQ
ncbi:MAG: hypothetical protein JWO92_717 [Chitinophagaceae bacterium]|nr:hypothetical protein [Chitinophagaceae bacterium]